MYTTATLRNVRCFYAKSVELTVAEAYSTVAELYRSNAAVVARHPLVARLCPGRRRRRRPRWPAGFSLSATEKASV